MCNTFYLFKRQFDGRRRQLSVCVSHGDGGGGGGSEVSEVSAAGVGQAGKNTQKKNRETKESKKRTQKLHSSFIDLPCPPAPSLLRAPTPFYPNILKYAATKCDAVGIFFRFIVAVFLIFFFVRSFSFLALWFAYINEYCMCLYIFSYVNCM